MRSLRAPLVAVVLLAGCGRSSGPDSYTWSGTIAPGGLVRLRNVSGSIRVARAAGDQAFITATRKYRGRRPEAVRMIAEEQNGGVVACAAQNGASSCDDRKGGTRGLLSRLLRRTSPTELEFIVALPAGARLDASNVNGSITVADAAGGVTAESVNGSVIVATTGGPVRAKTVNGTVSVRADSLAVDADVVLSSVNGTVSAQVPSDIAASVDLATTNGRVRTTFAQLPVTDRARRVRGVLGAGGGRSVKLHTVNGGVSLDRIGESPVADARDQSAVWHGRRPAGYIAATSHFRS